MNFLSKNNYSRTQTLKYFADLEGITLQDLAILSDLPVSTLSRLWQDHKWIDKLTGFTLQKLLSTIPELDNYLLERSLLVHLIPLIDLCQEYGIDFHQEGIKNMVDNHPVQYIILSLRALVYLLRGETEKTYNLLGRFWGVKRDVVIDGIWKPDSLIKDEKSIQKLYQSTEHLISSIKKKNSLSATVTRNILAHKMIKYAKADMPLEYNQRANQHDAFIYRAKAIGESFNDQESVIFYENQVKHSELLQRNELWSLLTFSGEIPVSSNFLLPKKINLTVTNEIILHELQNMSIGYQLYLVRIAIPILMRYDTHFGGKRDKLIKTLRTLQSQTSDKQLLSSITHLLVHDLSDKR